MEDKDMKNIVERIVADTIMSILTDNPTNKTTRQADSTESIAWIEVYDDELDKAYDMSQEYREYGKL
jgi:hypothetical protein